MYHSGYVWLSSRAVSTSFNYWIYYPTSVKADALGTVSKVDYWTLLRNDIFLVGAFLHLMYILVDFVKRKGWFKRFNKVVDNNFTCIVPTPVSRREKVTEIQTGSKYSMNEMPSYTEVELSVTRYFSALLQEICSGLWRLLYCLSVACLNTTLTHLKACFPCCPSSCTYSLRTLDSPATGHRLLRSLYAPKHLTVPSVSGLR